MNTWKYAILSMLPFIIGIAIISPFQDVFYGGDDWAYAWSVLNLIETSKLEASDWAAAQAVPQILWGALFVKTFGWSINILNISTMVAAFLAGLALFYILVALGFRSSVAFLATVVVTVSPIYLGMSITFMTDSMFTSLTLVATAFYVRAILNRSVLFAVLGGLFCGAAFLNRQFGIVLVIAYPVALIFWYIVATKYDCKKDIIRLVVSGLILPVSTVIIYFVHPDFWGGRTIAQAFIVDTSEVIMRLFNVPKIAIKSIIMYDYLIVLLCPLFVPFLFSGQKKLMRFSNNKWLLGCVSLLLLAGPMVWYLRLGVGVQGDVFQVNAKYGNNEIWSERIWWGLLILCIIPGTLIIGRIWKSIQSICNAATFKLMINNINSGSSSIAILFIALYTVGLTILVASHISFYNNYFLSIIPFFAICILFILRDLTHNLFISVAMVLVLFSTSVLYTESTVRYVEASWAEANALVRAGSEATKTYPWPSWYGWKNVNEIHDYMRHAAEEGDFQAAANVKGNAYNEAHVYVIGSKLNPLYNEITARSISYKTILGRRELWVVQKDFN